MKKLFEDNAEENTWLSNSFFIIFIIIFHVSYLLRIYVTFLQWSFYLHCFPLNWFGQSFKPFPHCISFSTVVEHVPMASLNFKLTVKAWGEKGMKGVVAILLILSFYNIAKPPRCLSLSRHQCCVYLACCFLIYILILLDIFTVKLCTNLCLTLNKTDLYILHWLILSSSVSTKSWGQPSATGSPSSTCTTSKSTTTVDCKSTLLHLTWRRRWDVQVRFIQSKTKIGAQLDRI